MLHEPIVAAETRRITVMQGQARASATPGDVFTTVLGSCIACCLFDPVLGIGGMNHFLLAEPAGKGGKHRVDEHYGAYLMELLINEMLALGAMKSRMKAHLYGGANMHAGMTKIGTANAEFAQRFLDQERIVIAHANMGGAAMPGEWISCRRWAGRAAARSRRLRRRRSCRRRPARPA